MAEYHISNKAVEDLSSIWEYTLKTWSEAQADSYYNELLKTFNGISKRPCFFDKEYSEVHPGLFCRKCKKHLVFYTLDDNDEVEIIRILHERMDIAKQVTLKK